MASESVIGSEHFEHFTCMWRLFPESRAVPRPRQPEASMKATRDYAYSILSTSATMDRRPPSGNPWLRINRLLPVLGGGPLRHGFSESTLALEQCGLSLSDQDIGCVTELLCLFHEALRRLPDRLRPESYF